MSIRARLDETLSHSLYLWFWKVRDFMLFCSLGMFIIGILLVDKIFGVYLCGIGLMFVTGLTFIMMPMELLGYGFDVQEDT